MNFATMGLTVGEYLIKKLIGSPDADLVGAVIGEPANTALNLTGTKEPIEKAIIENPKRVYNLVSGKTGKNVISFIKKILKWPVTMLKFDYDFITGRAYSVYGLAPYFALVGMLMIPLQIISPTLMDYPFQFLGVSAQNLVSFQVYSAVYWTLIMIMEFLK